MFHVIGMFDKGLCNLKWKDYWNKIVKDTKHNALKVGFHILFAKLYFLLSNRWVGCLQSL